MFICLGRRKEQEQLPIVSHLPVFLEYGSNPAQHVSKLFLICQIEDRDYGVSVDLSLSASWSFTIWFIGLIHLERGYTGNKPIFEFEGLSTTLLYLD